MTKTKLLLEVVHFKIKHTFAAFSSNEDIDRKILVTCLLGVNEIIL